MAWAALGAIGGALIGGGSSIAGTILRNRAARDSTNRQISFQRDMFNTLYSRQVREYKRRYQLQMKDMRRAGLNPILSYNQTPPIMPQGGLPTGASYRPGNIFAGVPEAVNTAVRAYQASGEYKQREQAIEQSKAEEEKKSEEAKTEKARRQNIWADTQVKNAEAVLRSVEIGRVQSARKLLESQTVFTKLKSLVEEERAKIARAGGKAAEHEEEIWDTAFGRFLKWLDVTGRSVNPFVSSARRATGD